MNTTKENLNSPNPNFSRIKNFFTLPDEPLLKTEEIKVSDLKNTIESNGFNLDLNLENINSLKESQFRNYESGRGLAMSVVLGSKKDEFENLIQNVCQDYSRSIKGDKTRGARQLAADLISVAVGALSSDEFCNRTNRRCQKSRLPDFDDPITGLPPHAAEKVIEFFLG